MKNVEIRNAAAESGVRLWEIAEELGIAEATFLKHLRREFSEEKKADALHAIQIISKRKEGGE